MESIEQKREQFITENLIRPELEESIDLTQGQDLNRMNSFSEQRGKWNSDFQYYMSVLGFTVGTSVF